MNVKKNLGWIIPVGIIVVLVMWAIGGYNGMVKMDEQVQNKWANVETQYQRRADLIPNLVSTVKGYAKHEQQTLEDVVKARSEATQLKVDAENLTPEKLAAFQHGLPLAIPVPHINEVFRNDRGNLAHFQRDTMDALCIIFPGYFHDAVSDVKYNA